MSKLMRRMTGKSALMKKAAQDTLEDDELAEMIKLEKLPDEARGKTRKLLSLLGAIRQCNRAKDLSGAIRIIIDSACKILDCDRATVFIVDEQRQELVVRAAVGAEDIRLPLDAGIAGAVYQNGRKLNIPDAYKDDRFNPEADKKSGYKTQSILCLPIIDESGNEIAVLQAINKKQPNNSKKFQPFDPEDEVLGEHMAMQVGIVLSNHLLNEKTKRAHAQVISLLEIVRSLHSHMGINSLMFTITEKSPRLVDADRCTLYLVDRARDELWSLQGAVEIRVPMTRGLAGACASSGQIINIEDAHKDNRFNTEYDEKTGYRTRQVLVHPIFDDPTDGSERSVVGALQMINKLHGGSFTKEDEELLGSFLDIAGSVLVTSQLFNSARKKLSEFGAAADIGDPNGPLGEMGTRQTGIRPTSTGSSASGGGAGTSNRVRSLRATGGRNSSGVGMIVEGVEEEE